MRDERTDRTVTVSTERVYATLDKSKWGPGPWQSEPDKVQFVDPATKLPCLAVRGGSGSWCGYVGVAEGHPLFGVPYNGQLDGDGTEGAWPNSPEGILNVHGGITFSDLCQEGAPEESSVCHIPAPGEPDHVWWFGFDAAHAGDYSPKMDRELYAMFGNQFGRTGGPKDYETYRTLEYIREQCAELAAQLLAIGTGGEDGR